MNPYAVMALAVGLSIIGYFWGWYDAYRTYIKHFDKFIEKAYKAGVNDTIERISS